MGTINFAIVGPVNAGKSALFNRLAGYKYAVIGHLAGLTRDPNWALASWSDQISVWDTAGLIGDTLGSADTFDVTHVSLQVRVGLENKIRSRSEQVISDANHLLIIVDGSAQLPNSFYAWIERVRKLNDKAGMTLVVNKVDLPLSNEDFYVFGMPVMFISVRDNIGISKLREHLGRIIWGQKSDETGRRYDNLLSHSSEPDDVVGQHANQEGQEGQEGQGDQGNDDAVKDLSAAQAKLFQSSKPDIKNNSKVMIIGRPNVGKSTLMNTLLGYECSITDCIPGVTRDIIFANSNLGIVLMDTPGLRRRARLDEKYEKDIFYKCMRALKGVSVAILVIDAVEGITGHDQVLLYSILKSGCGAMLVFNKWDIVDKSSFEVTMRRIKRNWQYIPICKISALRAKGIMALRHAIHDVRRSYSSTMRTSALNKMLTTMPIRLPLYKGNPVRLKYMVQVGSAPMRFAVFCNFPNAIRQSDRAFIANQIRKEFALTGVLVLVEFRQS